MGVTIGLGGRLQGYSAVEPGCRKYSEQGLVIVGISLDENEDEVRKFVEERQLTYGIAINSGTATAYKVEEIPRNYIIDTGGLIHHSHIGFMPGIGIIESEIETLLHKNRNSTD